MIREAIRHVVEGYDLTYTAARTVMREMMLGEATPSQIAAFLTAMKMKGVREHELLGFITEMLDKAVRIPSPPGAIDICGTGGDNSGTFNVSTVASFVVSAAGTPVAKHGNRSVSSKCGSADLLRAMGIPFDLDPPYVEKCLTETNLGFLFAPTFHMLMKDVNATRKEIGIPTLFNVLGPLANPANPPYRLIGVYRSSIAQTVANILLSLGLQHALVVHGNGLDEITNTGETTVVELKENKIYSYNISPVEFGIDLAEPDEIRGGDPFDNARIALSVLRGKPGPKLDIVLINAGAALYVANMAENIEEGIKIAREAIKSGKAYSKLKGFHSIVNRLEAERQRTMNTTALRKTLLCPESLVQRCKDLTTELTKEIMMSEQGARLLGGLDDNLFRSPGALTVIILTKILRLLSEGKLNVHTQSRFHRHACKKLSDAILSAEGLAILGEYKNRIPSSKDLYIPPEPSLIAELYGRYGLEGMSVIVEEDFFLGSANLFSFFRNKIDIPMLFKDFIVSEQQIRLAAELGADSILIISKALKCDRIEALVQECIRFGLEPIVEVHDVGDVEKILSCSNYDNIDLIGINSRNLQSLKTDLSILPQVKKMITGDKLLIAESGIAKAEDLEALKGFDAALIGSSFLTAEKPADSISEIVAAARRTKK
ncbi:MAG: anthranilate phosphoribosyltransferase [Methanomassiliicoccales archaeon]|jgi:anthranilate phosphoribosyltransferase|nr:anthranilate phosphoribosyltransferase [Methanomassiliicoccales archaeon]